jgi:hypothetical protein
VNFLAAVTHSVPVIVRSMSPEVVRQLPSIKVSNWPTSDTGISLAKADEDSILIGVAGVAAVLWVGSFIFLSLPQMRLRYPVKVAAGLSFLQSTFILALLAIVVPAIALRILAAIAGLYYLCVVPLQRLTQRAWGTLTTGKELEYKVTTSDGKPTTVVSSFEARRAYGDIIARATAWPLSLQLSLMFFVVAAWPTKYCVAVAGVFLIWQGSRFVRAALVDYRIGRLAPSTEPAPKVDIEKALKTLHLGFLLRFKFIREKIEKAEGRPDVI